MHVVSRREPSTELTRRLSEARKSFGQLETVWKHANISKEKTIRILDACVVSKLMYYLESMWLLQDNRAKLDGFYASCLQKILKIPSAYLSRVANKRVLEIAGRPILSQQLLSKQLNLYGKIYRMGASSLVRRMTFKDDGSNAQCWDTKRRVGRPRLEWSSCVRAHAVAIAAEHAVELHAVLRTKTTWEKAVHSYSF